MSRSATQRHKGFEILRKQRDVAEFLEILVKRGHLQGGLWRKEGNLCGSMSMDECYIEWELDEKLMRIKQL
ncbi:hypothetical protein RRG08_030475 [Elysia crispata]|uniref:Uncharacterized protein n=1 Tax=Elysia crispata TaxID=231223 RepID=A0AAE1E8A8_9GAST|nr:hypothetical protein RRG08_030475 [Elysia crispata]